MDFSRIEYRGIKCGSDLKTYKQNVPENLGLQTSGISRQQTLSTLVSIGAPFTFAPGFVTCSTIHIICGCITAGGKITHGIPALTNWNL